MSTFTFLTLRYISLNSSTRTQCQYDHFDPSQQLAKMFHFRVCRGLLFVTTIFLLTSFSQTSLATCDGSIPSLLKPMAKKMAVSTISYVQASRNGCIANNVFDTEWKKHGDPSVNYLSDATLRAMAVEYKNELILQQCNASKAEEAHKCYYEFLTWKRGQNLPSC